MKVIILLVSILLSGCAGTGFDKKTTLVPDEIWISGDFSPGAKLGNLSPLWKGTTRLNKRIRTNSKYTKWRSDIFQRDDWTCQTCRKRGVYIEAHHLKELSKIIEENKIKTIEQAISCDFLWNIDNGVTLCEDCHNLTKKGNTKRWKKLK